MLFIFIILTFVASNLVIYGWRAHGLYPNEFSDDPRRFLWIRPVAMARATE